MKKRLIQRKISTLIPSMNPPAISPNLFLVNMDPSHAVGYSDILSEADTYHFLSESGPVDVETARLKIQSNQVSTQSGKSIYWSIVGWDQVFRGFLAIHGFQAEQVAISYGIHPDFRRKGIASSVVKAVLEWGGLAHKKINLATHVENTASFQLLSQMELSYQGIQETPFGKRHVFMQTWVA